MPADALRLELEADAAVVAALTLAGRADAVDDFIDASRYRERLDQYRRQQNDRRATLPQPPDTAS